jgi:DNA mismatch repair protein MutS
MAGMPQHVLTRAEEILKWLEKSHETPVGTGLNNGDNTSVPAGSARLMSTQAVLQQPEMQLSFIQLDDPLLEEIKNDILNINIDTLTPVEALMKLHTIRGLLQRKDNA